MVKCIAEWHKRHGRTFWHKSDALNCSTMALHIRAAISFHDSWDSNQWCYLQTTSIAIFQVSNFLYGRWKCRNLQFVQLVQALLSVQSFPYHRRVPILNKKVNTITITFFLITWIADYFFRSSIGRVTEKTKQKTPPPIEGALLLEHPQLFNLFIVTEWQPDVFSCFPPPPSWIAWKYAG